jgi:uncharacterized SAM-binding protein YcdF (DUF218 family)
MFLLKRIISHFLYPVSLTLIFSFGGLFLLFFTSKQKLGKTFILIGVTILAFCSFTPTTDIFIKPLKERYPPYRHDNSLMLNSTPKLIVVLGAGYDSYASIPIVSRIGDDSLVRLVEGIRIYRMIPDGKLLLSGGSALGTVPCAMDMAELAIELGVNEKDIVIESKSRDTRDQARIINSIIGGERFILVTSSSHMPRSMALFSKLGMKPVPAPTISIEEKLLYRGPNPFIPSSINLQKSEIAFHEYLGNIWAKLREQI